MIGMGIQAAHSARATCEGDEHCGTCHGAWAKYSKKQLDGAAGHIWDIFNTLRAPRATFVGLGSPHFHIAREGSQA